MLVSELQYDLPPDLIAQHPAERRDQSRLLVLRRVPAAVEHRTFTDLPDLLPPGALLVLNDTRVLPARLHMHRRTGGRIEGLFLHEEAGAWQVMLTGAGRLRPGELLQIDGSSRTLRLLQRTEPGVWQAEPVPAGNAVPILNEVGHPPLPPYIARATGTEPAARKSDLGNQNSEIPPHPSATRDTQSAIDERHDVERYQTIYARVPGAVAAPTAGLHFTPEVFDRLDQRGIHRVHVTLHVGVGTFAPIRVESLADHPMHAEWYECSPETAAAVNNARRDGRPVVAIGTTSVRVLESCASPGGAVTPGSGWTRIFIYPPYRFRAVDILLTNFHLPGSTLLALVFAFAGREQILHAYDEAIRARYRFYSYGDAMLIL